MFYVDRDIWVQKKKKNYKNIFVNNHNFGLSCFDISKFYKINALVTFALKAATKIFKKKLALMENNF